MNRSVGLSTALVLSVALLMFAGGCSVLDQSVDSSPAPSETATSSQSDLDHRYELDEPVRVGPYEIVLTRVRFIDDPNVETSLAWVPELPEGMAQADIAIEVRNPASDDGESLPMSATDGAFRLEGDTDGVVVEYGVGLTPPPPEAGDGGTPQSSAGMGGVMDRKIAPGERMAIYPQYVVSSGAGPLTLTYAPFRDDPDTIVKFAIK